MKSPLLEHPAVMEIAKELQKTPAQVLLKWALTKGFRIIPKTCGEERMRENFQLDFELPKEHMETLSKLDSARRLTWKGVDPATVM